MTIFYRYKGYVGSVDVQEDSFTGKIEGIAETVTYSGKSRFAIQRAFKKAVNEYLAKRKSSSTRPSNLGAKLIVQLDPALYGPLIRAARRRRTTLNQFCTTALLTAIVDSGQLSRPRPNKRTTVTEEDIIKMNQQFIDVVTRNNELPDILNAYQAFLSSSWALVERVVLAPHAFVSCSILKAGTQPPKRESR